MISPYFTGAAACVTSSAGFSTSGSGYGTSSGTMRSMIDGSQRISPPARMVNTSFSSSTGSAWCSLIESVRPVLKNTISALAGRAQNVKDTKEKTKATKGLRPCRIFLPRIHKRVKHPDAELARILAARVDHGGHDLPIDRSY